MRAHNVHPAHHDGRTSSVQVNRLASITVTPVSPATRTTSEGATPIQWSNLSRRLRPVGVDEFRFETGEVAG